MLGFHASLLSKFSLPPYSTFGYPVPERHEDRRNKEPDSPTSEATSPDQYQWSMVMYQATERSVADALNISKLACVSEYRECRAHTFV